MSLFIFLVFISRCHVDRFKLSINFFSLNPADVLSEEAILKWYKDAHAVKGKSVFLEQMKKFVEWLQNAEEGNNIQLPLFHTDALRKIDYYCKEHGPYLDK